MHFGEHLTVDGYGGNPNLLNNKELILHTLNELVKAFDMHKLAEEKVYFAPSNDAKDPGGWSGYVIITESHVSIHTFPARQFLSADFYTCKNGFDTEAALGIFVKNFELKDIETHFLTRGTRYPGEDLSPEYRMEQKG